ncbi:hypothetical protein AAFC00_006381 [Neodothiora populina]|uniref:Beta-lactamase-related domain-containing protein n=1 Tax=Neodothiora populina TaxID=2781224 RepID=A0ABR3P4Z6_9PEZI
MPVNQQAHDNVQKSLDSITSDAGLKVPGMVFTAVDKNGDAITENVSGTRGLDTKKPMTLDTVFWIASCTKLLATIAAMQLAEQGKLSLDDHNELYKVLPELKDKKVLQEDGSLVDKTSEITLRRLLNHTAGFGYEIFNKKLMEYGRPAGFDVFSGDIHDIVDTPLVNQPGSRWEYGVNIDWAGIAVERVSGLTLNDYLKQNVFAPLGVTNIDMLPSDEMKAHLAAMHQRLPNGETLESDHPMRRSLKARSDADKARIFNSAGAGCFAQPTQYVQILVALLNNGTHPKTKKQILKPETVDEMFENQIPEFPDFARNTPLPPCKNEYSNAAPELYPEEGDPPQGWGLSFMITTKPGMTGRGRQTAWWAGIANLFWWCDREKGVAGIIASQVLPFGDPVVMGQWFACEKAVYDAIA